MDVSFSNGAGISFSDKVDVLDGYGCISPMSITNKCICVLISYNGSDKDVSDEKQTYPSPD